MKLVCYWAVLVALFLGFQEAIVRAIFPLPAVTNFNRVNYTATAHAAAASFLGQRQSAMNAAFLWNSKPDGASFVSHLNLYGFRDHEWDRKPARGTKRVMFVGDSLVEGFMAPDEQTISRGYEHATRSRTEAMNMGIGGNGLPEYLALIHDALPLFHPQTLIVFLYANDLPSGASSALAAAPFQPNELNIWAPRLAQTLARVAHHEPVPRRWHSPPVLFVPVVPDPLNPWTHPPPDYALVDPEIAEAMRTGGFNPFVVDLLNKAAAALQQPVDLSGTLLELKNFARAQETELRVVYLPFSTQVSDRYRAFQQKYVTRPGPESLRGARYQIHRETLAANCASLAIPFLDLTPLFRAAEEKGEHLYWDYDEHLRGPGYLRVGATIAQWSETGRAPERLAGQNDVSVSR